MFLFLLVDWTELCTPISSNYLAYFSKKIVCSTGSLNYQAYPEQSVLPSLPPSKLFCGTEKIPTLLYHYCYNRWLTSMDQQDQLHKDRLSRTGATDVPLKRCFQFPPRLIRKNRLIIVHPFDGDVTIRQTVNRICVFGSHQRSKF